MNRHVSNSRKKSTVSLRSLLNIELMKLRRSHIFWILLIPAVMMWIPSAMNAGVNFQTADLMITPEHNFFIQGYMGMSWFMIPATIVICTVLLNQTERTNKGLLKMLSLPVSVPGICFAKFLVLLCLMAIQMICSILCYYAGAALASRLEDYSFALEPPYVVRTVASIYLSILPMAALFWMLATLIRTPVFSVGIGLASIVPSVLMLNTKLWPFYPPDYPFYILMTEYGRQSEGIFTTSIQWTPLLPFAGAVTVLCLGIACLRFGKSELK